MKVALIIFGVVAFGFILMVAYLYVNQRKILYFQQGLDHELDHIKANKAFEFEVNRNGCILRGWLLNQHNKKLLIYYGGNAEEVSLVIDQYKALDNVSTLLMNYRGYGESEGQPSEENIIGDALAIVDTVSDGFDSIVLMGRSLGSGVAVQVASQREVEQLILVTPYDSIAAVGQGMYPWAPVKVLLKDQFDSVAASANVSVPTLFLIAEMDTIVPRIHSERLAEQWKGSKQWMVIHGSDHNSIPEFPAYWEALTNFLSSYSGR